MLLLSAGHIVIEFRKVKYILLTIQLLGLDLDLHVGCHRPVQSSVERYDVCGPGRTIEAHT